MKIAKKKKNGPKVYLGTLRLQESSTLIRPFYTSVITHPSELGLPANRPTWVLFGDESTGESVITYGIVGFEYPWQANTATFAFQRVMERFGSSAGARIHCRELFSGEARKRSEWAHLTEAQTIDLVRSLVVALIDHGAKFFLGIVYSDTFPIKIPAGKGQGVRFTNEHGYAFGFISAAAAFYSLGNRSPHSRYVLLIDEQSGKANFWGIGNVQIRRMMSLSGLDPKADNHLLVDAADILAYAAGRTFSDAAARNRGLCEEIVQLCRPQIAHYWWQAEDTVTSKMKERLGLQI